MPDTTLALIVSNRLPIFLSLERMRQENVAEKSGEERVSGGQNPDERRSAARQRKFQKRERADEKMNEIAHRERARVNAADQDGFRHPVHHRESEIKRARKLQKQGVYRVRRDPEMT